MAKTDKLFEYIGEFGTFQLWLFVIMTTLVSTTMEYLQINFIAGEMDHWCDIEGVNHLPHSQQKYIAIPQDEDGDYDRCHYFLHNYTDEDLMNWNRTLMNPEGTTEAQCTGWVYDQSEFYSTYMATFDLVCGETWKISLISSFYMLGYLIGTVSVGAVSDTIGRKKCFFIFFILKIFGTFLSTFAPSYWVLAFSRFVIGIGVCGYLANYILMMECVSDQYRSILGSLYWLMAVTGYILVVWSAYVVRHEVYFQLIYATAQLPLLLFWFVLPESPRWLLLRGKYKEAERVIRHIAAINKIDLPADLDCSAILSQPDIKETPKGKCVDLVRSRRMFVRTAIICLHWFTDSLLSYALSFNTGKLPGSLYLNTLLAGLIAIPADLIVMFCLNWRLLGRRWTNAGTLIVAGIINFCIVPMILSGRGTAMTTLSIIGLGFVTAAFTGIYVYTAEIFPTEVRNLGTGWASLFARISGMIAPFVGGPLYGVWAALPNLIFGLFGTVSGALILLLPETLGAGLFETVKEAEAFTGKKNSSSSIYLNSSFEPDVKPSQSELVGFTRNNGAYPGLFTISDGVNKPSRVGDIDTGPATGNYEASRNQEVVAHPNGSLDSSDNVLAVDHPISSGKEVL